MRTLYATALGIALSTQAAHAQQPFERLGVKVPVLTLSNGRYPEFFPNDSLRRIGSVVYNRRLHRIAYLLPADSLTYPPAEVTSRWFSPDPLAEKDIYISPYAFARDNAIRYIDTDGREIVDPKGKPITYSVNSNGSVSFSPNATESARTFITELLKNDAGTEALKGLTEVITKVSVELTSDRGIDRGDGKNELEGHTDGRGSVVDPKTGRTVYKTADITIYLGTYEAEKNGEGKTGTETYAKSSKEKFINGVGTHEANHSLNDLESNKKAAKEPVPAGSNMKEQQAKAREVIPNQQEQKANANYPTN